MKLKRKVKLNYDNYPEASLESLATLIKGDAFPDDIDSDYYNADDKSQNTRIEDYVVFAQSHCDEASTVGLWHKGPLGIFSRKVINFGIFAHIALLALDAEHKLTLFRRLSELIVNGTKVTLFLPKDVDTFDIGIRW